MLCEIKIVFIGKMGRNGRDVKTYPEDEKIPIFPFKYYSL